jgi:glycerophosphoryl diester phosphodiesterase
MQEGSVMAKGISILSEGRQTRLKWHRLRRSMTDPPFGTEAMAAGFALGASMELDLRVRGDGGFVVLHDETLDRETTGAGRVADLAGAVLASMTYRQSGSTLVLSEGLAAMLPSADPGGLLQFDMKDDLDAVGPRGIDHLADHFGSVQSPIIFSGGSTALIRALAERLPHIPRGVDPTDRLVDIGTRQGLAVAEAALVAELRDGTEPDTCYLNWELVLECHRRGLDLVALCHAEGVKVDAWTYNLSDPQAGFTDTEWDEFRLLMSLRPDQITTDEPCATEAAWQRRMHGTA